MNRENQQQTDEELMELYKLGHYDAFEELFSRHKSLLYGFIKKRIGSRSDIDDVFQEVFLKLHHNRHKYNRSFPFLPWLFTLCKNSLIDFHRKKSIHREHILYDTTISENRSTESLINLPEQSLDLKNLNSKQRDVIKMRFEQDFSFEEIAKKLQTSPANARQMASRAIKKLKNIMKMEAKE